MLERKEFYALGKWIVDYIKEIDVFPQQNKLTPIYEEFQFGGGGAFNVLMNLSLINNSIDLYALGFLGGDTSGNFILERLQERNINTSLLNILKYAQTSYVIVLSERKSPMRSFLFKNSYIDNNFSKEDIKKITSINFNNAIFYIGYLNLIEGLLKDNMLMIDLLKKVKTQKGFIVADCVSLANNTGIIDFKNLIELTMPFIDVLLMNEIELEIISSKSIRNNDKKINFNIIETEILKFRKLGSGICIVHFPEGAYLLTQEDLIYVESFFISKDTIIGTVGAGDAFCAGVINAIICEKSIQDILREGHAMAWYNLKSNQSVFMDINTKKIKNLIQNHSGIYGNAL